MEETVGNNLTFLEVLWGHCQRNPPRAPRPQWRCPTAAPGWPRPSRCRPLVWSSLAATCPASSPPLFRAPKGFRRQGACWTRQTRDTKTEGWAACPSGASEAAASPFARCPSVLTSMGCPQGAWTAGATGGPGGWGRLRGCCWQGRGAQPSARALFHPESHRVCFPWDPEPGAPQFLGSVRERCPWCCYSRGKAPWDPASWCPTAVRSGGYGPSKVRSAWSTGWWRTAACWSHCN